jgi:hypothetical protein
LGALTLAPEQEGQTVDLVVRNSGADPVNGLFGLNFALQVGDGTAGPKITSVNLAVPGSIFAGYAVNQVDQGSNPWIAFYGIDTAGRAASLPPTSSTVLARVTFDTRGLGPAVGLWSLSIRDVGPFHGATEYVLTSGATQRLDQVRDGQLTLASAERPRLTVVRSGDSVRVSWPSSTAAGYTLESIESVSQTTWKPVDAAITSSEGVNSALLGASGVSRFFQLQKQ